MTNENQPGLNQTLSFADGRILGYAEYGDANGFPMFHFHGHGSSRLEGQWLAEAADQAHIRLIVPDRPGSGLSDFHDNLTFKSWAEDVKALADGLEIGRFALLGLSGGGAFALATSYYLSKQVTALGIVSGIAPPEMPAPRKGAFFGARLSFWAARHFPSLAQAFLKQTANSYTNPENFRKTVIRSMPAPDRELAESNPEAIYQFAAAAVESHRQGIEGNTAEMQLYVHPWGFPLNSITPPVSLWYGKVDNFVPPQQGRFLAAHIPGSQLNLVDDGGHFSTIHNHAAEILSELKLSSQF